MGIIEKYGKTNAIYYILPRKYYELTGDLGAYSLATDWGIDQVWAVILPFLQKNGKAKRPELEKVVGSDLSTKQLRRFLDILRKEGFLKTEGQRNSMVYMIGDAYDSNSKVISKALAIGLQKLKEDGEI